MKNSFLSFLGQSPKRVCHGCDFDWEYEKSRYRESDILETLHKQGIEKHHSVPHEMDRRLRAEQLIEMGKSYRPLTAERCPDEPDLDRD
jgi:hypothetical protein